MTTGSMITFKKTPRVTRNLSTVGKDIVPVCNEDHGETNKYQEEKRFRFPNQEAAATRILDLDELPQRRRFGPRAKTAKEAHRASVNEACFDNENNMVPTRNEGDWAASARCRPTWVAGLQCAEIAVIFLRGRLASRKTEAIPGKRYACFELTLKSQLPD